MSKNASIDDIEWVVLHLGLNGYVTQIRSAGDHQKLFNRDDEGDFIAGIGEFPG